MVLSYLLIIRKLFFGFFNPLSCYIMDKMTYPSLPTFLTFSYNLLFFESNLLVLSLFLFDCFLLLLLRPLHGANSLHQPRSHKQLAQSNQTHDNVADQHLPRLAVIKLLPILQQEDHLETDPRSHIAEDPKIVD